MSYKIQARASNIPKFTKTTINLAQKQQKPDQLTLWVETDRLSFVPAKPNDLGCQTQILMK